MRVGSISICRAAGCNITALGLRAALWAGLLYREHIIAFTVVNRQHFDHVINFVRAVIINPHIALLFLRTFVALGGKKPPYVLIEKRYRPICCF